MTTDLLDKTNQVAEREDAPAPAIIAEGPGALLNAIVMLAKDPAVDVTKLQALLEMQGRMEAKDAEREFNRAFSEMEPKLPRIKKNGDVEYKNKNTGLMEKSFKFGKWEDVDSAIRPILREHGFSLSFDTQPRQGDGGGLICNGTLLHTGGHSKRASIALPLDASGGKNNLQGMGSSFSYGKRYTTTMLLNLVFEGDDDDGQKGGLQYITPEQIATIKRLIAETNTNEVRFLETIGVGEIAEIKQGEFVIAANLLNSKKQKANAS